MTNQQVDSFQKIMDKVIEFFVNYSFEVVGAVIVLIIGFILAKFAANFVLKLCEKKNLDITLSKFFASIINLTVLSFAFIIALGKFGITIAPFVAALSAAAFGMSFAIQGPLSNYGAGLSIILSRPFTVGDVISVVGVHGVVQDVKLGCTVLLDEDGNRITIPNKHIVGEIVHNSRTHKLIEGKIGIAYDMDPEKAIELIRQVFRKCEDVATNPGAQIGIENFGDSSVDIKYRCWVPAGKRFQTLTKINQDIFAAFRKSGITIPFPQREVHLISETNKA